MTNYEKYQAEIITMLTGNLAINKKTGKPCLCEDTDCTDCKMEGRDCFCPSVVREFLTEEAGEQE